MDLLKELGDSGLKIMTALVVKIYKNGDWPKDFLDVTMIALPKKYGVKINIDKSQVMRVSRSNESLQIKVNNKELKEVDHFKYLGSVLTKDGYCTREIQMKIVIAKEAFNRNMSLLTSKLNIELKKNLVRCYVWRPRWYLGNVLSSRSKVRG